MQTVGELPFHHEQTIGHFQENFFQLKTNSFAAAEQDISFSVHFFAGHNLSVLSGWGKSAVRFKNIIKKQNKMKLRIWIKENELPVRISLMNQTLFADG